ncbi:MAG: glycosyltransferase family 39 protein [Chloroflexi bacterium]|nr:glycosyltransferase family 39 protein [Chloroflexota bacterium]
MRRNQEAFFILLWAILFGGFVRFYPVMQAGFPINDGGLFYQMILDLLAHNFRLPAFASYNGGVLPFAYPPFPFYFSALLVKLFQLDPLQILRWLPALLATLGLIPFFLLARELFRDSLKAALATFAYAMLPESFAWLIMGGGLTRAMGRLFALLTLFLVYRLYTTRQRRLILPAALSTVLLCLSHPEATVHTLGMVAVFWLFRARRRDSAIHSALVALLVLLFSAPWWWTVTQQHGWQIFRAAAQTGWQNAFGLTFLLSDFTFELGLSLIGVLALIGLLAQLLRREFLLPLLLLVPVLLEPRSAPTVVTIPLALLAAEGLVEVLFPAFARLTKRQASPDESESTLSALNGPLRPVTTFYLLYPILGAFSIAMILSANALQPAELSAMHWIKDNTPQSARFVLVTPTTTDMDTPLQEWFPVLSGRVSQNVVQGYEWLGREIFSRRRENFARLNACAYQTADCLARWQAASGLDFDYLYLTPVFARTYYEYSGLAGQVVGNSLLYALQASPYYEQVYARDEIYIFRKLK